MAENVITKPRDFPAVEELLQSDDLKRQIGVIPRPVAASIVKSAVAEAKRKLKKNDSPITHKKLLASIKDELEAAKRREIGRVINATGILVHTNLGRAPLSESIFEEIRKTVIGYGNVEFDTSSGKRGHRGEACEQYLAELTGAESATVVNNCAAALFIALNTMAARKKVLISRGELVQIGGGFRIPDILKRSGAKLCEVGSTNITTVKDYEDHIDDKTGLILKVHKSNFIQAGFTEEADLKDLVDLGRKHGVPVINDLGSGVFVPTAKILGFSEPTVQQSVRAGATLTTFSGDKMLGGAQAGLIVGEAEAVSRIKRNPIFRAVRVDKIVFSILEKLLTVYLNGTHLRDIKLWSLLSVPEAELYQRGKDLLDQLGHPEGVTVAATRVYVGGGTLPEADMPSVGLFFSAEHKARFLMKRFRNLQPPIIGRIEDDRFILDLKAVDREDLSVLSKGIRKVLKEAGAR